MLIRFTASLLSLLLVAGPVTGNTLYPLPEGAIRTAAEQLRKKDYRSGFETARAAPDDGVRDFVSGIAAHRLGQWDDAARHLAKAADRFPLLGDYALYYQAQSLQRLDQWSEAGQPLQRLLQKYPESPLFRPTLLLNADLLFSTGDFRRALDAYVAFIEKYPAGDDSLAALHKTALCREEMGETAAAVTILRKIVLKNAGTKTAETAEEDMKRLAAKGFAANPFTAEELLAMASSLQNLRKFDRTLAVLDSIPRQGLTAQAAARIDLKIGQTQFKSRRYREAHKTFEGVVKGGVTGKELTEARYWLAKSLDRTGREEDAAAVFLEIAAGDTASELADDALLNAAYVRKHQGRQREEIVLLNNLLEKYPKSSHKETALWETAWALYRSGEFGPAARAFSSVAEIPSLREKGLYWQGCACRAAGDTAGAEAVFAALLRDYPLSFYALTYREEARMATPPLPAPLPDLLKAFPLPSGYDRVKALITFGLREEAGKELALLQKKSGSRKDQVGALTRLYLELEDYSSPIAIFRKELPRSIEKENLLLWQIGYPLAYSDQVARQAASQGVPEWLVYAVIRAESSFVPSAVSPAGAVGLMQVMPATAESVRGSSRKSLSRKELASPETNIELGIRHLKDLLRSYNGDIISVVAAYNAGSGNVNRWKKSLAALPPAEFVESIPFAETREYVKKVLAARDIYRRLYGAPQPEEAARPGAAPPAGTPPAAPASGEPAPVRESRYPSTGTGEGAS